MECIIHSDGPFPLRKVEVGLYGVLKSEFQTHEVGIVPNLGLFRPSEIETQAKIIKSNLTKLDSTEINQNAPPYQGLVG